MKGYIYISLYRFITPWRLFWLFDQIICIYYTTYDHKLYKQNNYYLQSVYTEFKTFYLKYLLSLGLKKSKSKIIY